MTAVDTVSKIIAYESGEMDEDETIQFFASIIRSGLVWQLQGCYGRQAAALIAAGLIDREGTIVKDTYD